MFCEEISNRMHEYAGFRNQVDKSSLNHSPRLDACNSSPPNALQRDSIDTLRRKDHCSIRGSNHSMTSFTYDDFSKKMLEISIVIH